MASFSNHKGVASFETVNKTPIHSQIIYVQGGEVEVEIRECLLSRHRRGSFLAMRNIVCLLSQLIVFCKLLMPVAPK